jgi:hypothetical protein
MGPPPNPVLPAMILEPEVDALSLCLKVTVERVLRVRCCITFFPMLECSYKGRTDISILCRYPETVRQIYCVPQAAHNNASGIQKHAPTPPLSLTNALGREVEKYDQLCDAIESRLVSAFSIACRYRY